MARELTRPRLRCYSAPSRTVKALLLGAGESGKSTILKQMRLISQGAHTPEERIAYKEVIFSNAVQSMQVVVDAMEDLGIDLPEHLRKHAEFFQGMDVQPGQSLLWSRVMFTMTSDNWADLCHAGRGRQMSWIPMASYTAS